MSWWGTLTVRSGLRRLVPELLLQTGYRNVENGQPRPHVARGARCYFGSPIAVAATDAFVWHRLQREAAVDGATQQSQ